MNDIKNDIYPILVSVFSKRIIIPVFYSLITSLLLPAIVWYILTSSDIFDIIGGIVAFIICLMIWITMFCGELRLKALKISFKENHVEIRPFLGIGNTKIYHYDTISSFKSTFQPALPLPYECITLISNQKEVLHVSQYYFSNYTELKDFIKERFKDDGVVVFSLKKMFIEIFSR